MRTTLNIDDDLLIQAQTLAASTGRTLTDVIEDALRQSLRRRRAARKGKRVTLPTFRGDGLQPGVDLHHTSASLDLMDA